jgi:hypothetical protein
VTDLAFRLWLEELGLRVDQRALLTAQRGRMTDESLMKVAWGVVAYNEWRAKSGTRESRWPGR